MEQYTFADFIDELLSEVEAYKQKENKKEDVKVKENKDCYTKPEIKVNSDIIVQNEDSFKVPKLVNNKLTNESITINFAHEDPNMVYMGITEPQLLSILLYRNQNNAKRFELLTQVYDTYTKA